MQRYILRRAVQTVIVLWLTVSAIFLIGRLMGDPVVLMLPLDATKETIAQLRHVLGLDEPLYVQYGRFMARLVQGDLGMSIRGYRPVVDMIGDRLFNSVSLALAAVVVACLIAVPAGVVAALKRGSKIDFLARLYAVLGQAFPGFWLGLILMLLFSVQFEVFPPAGMGSIAHYVLPAVTLGWFISAGIMRLVRSGMIEALDSEYVKLARIKGLSEPFVVLKHALRNSLIAPLTFAGVYFGILVGAAIVIEVVFAWPGIGSMAYAAILGRDFPVMQGVILVVCAIVVFVNLFVDLLYAYIDPRIRYG